MKVGIVIGLVHLKITGYEPTSESSVLLSDIRAYIPAAVNYSYGKAYYSNISEAKNKDMPGTFYAFYPNITILKDADRGNWKYVTPPINIVPLGTNRGVRSVMDNCHNVYTPLPDHQMSSLKYWGNIFRDESFYRIEGQKIYVFNMNPLVDKINLSLLINADNLTDDDEMPILAGSEADIIDLLHDLVIGKKELNKDVITDGKDNT